MIKYFLIFFIFFCIPLYAAPLLTSVDYVMPAPPTTENTLSLFQYLNNIYQHWNTLQVTTQEPNANFTGNYGQEVIYYDGSNYWLAIQKTSPEGTSWVGVKLGVV